MLFAAAYTISSRVYVFWIRFVGKIKIKIEYLKQRCRVKVSQLRRKPPSRQSVRPLSPSCNAQHLSSRAVHRRSLTISRTTITGSRSWVTIALTRISSSGRTIRSAVISLNNANTDLLPTMRAATAPTSPMNSLVVDARPPEINIPPIKLTEVARHLQNPTIF